MGTQSSAVENAFKILEAESPAGSCGLGGGGEELVCLAAWHLEGRESRSHVGTWAGIMKKRKGSDQTTAGVQGLCPHDCGVKEVPTNTWFSQTKQEALGR